MHWQFVDTSVHLQPVGNTHSFQNFFVPLIILFSLSNPDKLGSMARLRENMYIGACPNTIEAEAVEGYPVIDRSWTYRDRDPSSL